MEEYKIITSNNPHYLSGEVNSHIKEGWKRVGSHQVVAVNMTVNMTNRMAGNTIHGANYEIEYSQTMVKEASNGTNV